MWASMLTPVILSGGSGTRLWPLSRELYPEAAAALMGRHTMLQDTALRLDGLGGRRTDGGVQRGTSLPGGRAAAPARRPGPRDHPRAGRPQHRAGRSRSPALQAAPEDLLLVLPADHVIRDAAAFRAAVNRALPAADGRAPRDLRHRAERSRRPATATSAAARAEGDGVPHRAVRREAGRAIGRGSSSPSGEYYWNSGMFLFRADRYLAELGRFAPDIAAARASLRRRRVAGPRLRPRGQGGFEACRERLHRLRRDGEDRRRRRRPARRGLERRRFVGRAARRVAGRSARQRHARRRAVPRTATAASSSPRAASSRPSA